MSVIKYGRRHFLSAAAMTIAASELTAFGFTGMKPAIKDTAMKTIKNGSAKRFDKIKQINAGPLNIGYVDAGTANGPVVILLHGWPYDIHAYADVAPLLVAKGYRVIIPHLRGYGTTRFLSEQTARSGQQSVFAADTIALMDALDIRSAVIGGFDWGARAACIIAAIWPERCKALVSVSGYLIINLEANQQPLSPQAELGWWYQYYFATERGRAGYGRNTNEFAKLIWKLASPRWNFDDVIFDRSSAAFKNPDHVPVVIHNYRWRLGLAEGDPQYDPIEEKLSSSPVIKVPAITIGSDFDGNAADGKKYATKFSGKYSHRILDGIGHNVPQEAPEAFADAIITAAGYAG